MFNNEINIVNDLICQYFKDLHDLMSYKFDAQIDRGNFCRVGEKIRPNGELGCLKLGRRKPKRRRNFPSEVDLMW